MHAAAESFAVSGAAAAMAVAMLPWSYGAIAQGMDAGDAERGAAG